MRLRRALSIAAQMAVVVVWFLLLRPKALGGPASYIIVRGTSMEPTLHAGDLAVLLVGTNFSPGDVVAYQVEGGMVIHRVIGGSEGHGYITQGDNTPSPDGWRPASSSILGRMWLMIPGGGRFLSLLRTPYILGAIAGTLGALYVLNGGSGPAGRTDRARPMRHSPGGESTSGLQFGNLGRRVSLHQDTVLDLSNSDPEPLSAWRSQRIELPEDRLGLNKHSSFRDLIRPGLNP